MEKPTDAHWMRLAVRLARRAMGETSPNPMVGAVLVRDGVEIGKGWHHRAGHPHAEIEAIRDAAQRGNPIDGATLYVTLEPCSTHGRTPPCTDAILAAGIPRVVVGATDPNPRHAGRGLDLLREQGITVLTGVQAKSATALNRSFNHWIVHQTPLVTLKVGMTLDGKIATAGGESKWITGSESRRHGMRLRHSHDAVLVGIGTVLADDPGLTVRLVQRPPSSKRRVVLDSQARTPLTSQLVTDPFVSQTVIVVGEIAPFERREALAQRVAVWTAPLLDGRIDLAWLMTRLGADGITSLLVEGGGEVHAAFITAGLAHRAAFFYAPLILGGANAIKAVGGHGARLLAETTRLTDVRTKKVGDDLLLEANIIPPSIGTKPSEES